MPHHPPTPPPQPANARGRRRRKVGFQEPAENGEKEPLKPEPVLPPVAGHSLLAWQGTLLCIGGHTKVGMAWISREHAVHAAYSHGPTHVVL